MSVEAPPVASQWGPPSVVWIAASLLVLIVAAVAIIWAWIHDASRAVTTGIADAVLTAASEDGRWVAQADAGRIAVVDTDTGLNATIAVPSARSLLIVGAPGERADETWLAYTNEAGNLRARLLSTGADSRLVVGDETVVSPIEAATRPRSTAGWIATFDGRGKIAFVGPSDREVLVATQIEFPNTPDLALSVEPRSLEGLVAADVRATAIAGLARGGWLVGTTSGNVVLVRSEEGRPPSEPVQPVPSANASVRRLIVLDEGRIGSTEKTKAPFGRRTELTGHKKAVTAAEFSADGSRVTTASLDGTTRTWDASTGRLLREAPSDQIYAFSDDGGYAIAISTDPSEIKLIVPATGRVVSTIKAAPGESITVATISADGRNVAAGTSIGSILLWQAQTGRTEATGRVHRGEIRAVAFSPDATKLASTSEDGTIRLWGIRATGVNQIASPAAQGAVMTSISFSPDATRLVAAAADGTAPIWDATTGKGLAVLRGHTDALMSASFSPDGMQVLTTSLDGTAQIWDARTGARLVVLRGPASALSASFSPDGSRVVAGFRDGTAIIYSDDRTRFVAILDDGRRRVGTIDASGTIALSPPTAPVEALSLKTARRDRTWGRSVGGRPILDGGDVGDETPAGTVFKDCADCPQMVVVPAAPQPSARTRQEEPGSVALLTPFAVGKFEITRGEWLAFARDEGLAPTPCAVKTQASPDESRTNRHPVDCVSWSEATKYAAWLTRKTGAPYHLLTEGEWRYVARGEGDTEAWIGATEDVCAFANFAERPATAAQERLCRDDFRSAAPIGRFQPNRFGLHDVIGNVAEWVDDCWTDPPERAVRIAPQKPPRPDCSRRLVRGGSWSDPPPPVSVTYRDGRAADSRVPGVGFRVRRALSFIVVGDNKARTLTVQ